MKSVSRVASTVAACALLASVPAAARSTWLVADRLDVTRGQAV